ncbi:MAG TPA: hypothetical protein VKF61_04870 [Candidatus Polarisedimenticolia bacterium]|nr:hypothetical protein [Candidatus Polarisedimenticolia bacterium]
MRFRDADRDEIERVLAGRHIGLLDSARGGAHESLLVGCDENGRIRVALRLRSLPGTLDGRAVRIAHLTDAFPVDGPSGADEAADLRREALRQARESGHALAIEIMKVAGESPGLQGFRALPCSEAACRTRLPVPWPKEPPWLRAGEEAPGRVPGLRPGHPGDIDALAGIHAEEIAAQRLRVDRPRDLWDRFVLARDRSSPFWVIDRGKGVEAYVLLRTEGPTLRWCEHGARRGSEELLADLFWCALGWGRARGLQRIEGWRLPEILTVEPLYPTSDRQRKTDVVMLMPLDPSAPFPDLAREGDCRLWELDGFRDDPPPGAPSAG